MGFIHASMSSPVVSSFIQAVARGYLGNYPRITAKMIAANRPNTLATAKGHLDQTRQGQHSTKVSESLVPSSITTDLPTEEEEDDINIAFLKVTPLLETNHSDSTGRFPIISRKSNQYVFVSVLNDYIHMEPMPSRNGAAYVKAFSDTIAFYQERSATVRYQRLDNESSGLVEKYLKSKDITIEYVPPNTHRANKAESAILDAKNHSISSFSTAHPDFLLDMWDESLPQAEITLNLLQEYSPDSSKSAYEGLYGKKYDFLAHSIVPFGTLVVVHEKPHQRGSWDTHGVKGYYLGPALNHYRSWRTFVIKSQTQRISDTLAWFPSPLLLPGSNPYDMVHAAITDLTSALATLATNANLISSNQMPFKEIASTATQALTDLINMFQSPPTVPEQRVSNEIIQHIPLQQEQRVLSPPIIVINTVPQTSVVTSCEPTAPEMNGNEASSPAVMVGNVPLGNSVLSSSNSTFTSLPATISSDNQLVTSIPMTHPINALSDSKPKPYVAPRPTDRQLRRNPKRKAYFTKSTSSANTATAIQHAIEQAEAEREFQATLQQGQEDRLGFSGIASMASAHAALNLTDEGKPITYSNVKFGPNAKDWKIEESKEYSRLTDSDTIRPMLARNLPAGCHASYYNPQLREEEVNGIIEQRVRGTIGGDRIDYPGEVSARTDDMEVVKILLNSVVSDDASVMTLDIKDYYLGTPLDTTEYIRIDCKFIPEDCMIKYNLHQYIHNGSVLHSVHKGMYGLPQAGNLSQKQLIKHLLPHGYYQSKQVPCLFLHTTNSIKFTLIVDDFCVKYKNIIDAHHLIETLKKLYILKVDMSAKKCIGLTIEQDPIQHEISLSMPGHIPKLLEEVESHGHK